MVGLQTPQAGNLSAKQAQLGMNAVAISQVKSALHMRWSLVEKGPWKGSPVFLRNTHLDICVQKVWLV